MGNLVDVVIPDIGDFDQVEVIEVLVAPGDSVQAEDSLITLESDKATMEIPSPQAGVVQELKVAVGDKVGQGALIMTLTADGEAAVAEADPPPATQPEPVAEPAPATEPEPPAAAAAEPGDQAEEEPRRTHPVADHHPMPSSGARPHASPSVRRFARELGVGLVHVRGTGSKGRILKEDVQAFVKSALAKPPAPESGGGFSLPPMPEIDFSKFGEIEEDKLSKIKKVSGAHLHRSWISIPHVTHFDEADITDLEAFRKEHKDDAEEKGVKLTVLSFLMKAAVQALKEMPAFNASLANDGETLVLKKYYNIGVAVDTPGGLVVPVIRDVACKGLYALAGELMEISGRARDGRLMPKDMQGGSFSISSLGGIGGTAFTPIINAPEVAIMGVSRAITRPEYVDGEWVPRLILPFSVSYDHRVIDGAAAARFCRILANALTDVRKLSL